jgi:opacity protein-like surface antigen
MARPALLDGAGSLSLLSLAAFQELIGKNICGSRIVHGMWREEFYSFEFAPVPRPPPPTQQTGVFDWLVQLPPNGDWPVAKSAAIFNFATNWVIGIEADASWANSQGGDGSGRQTRSATLVGNLPGITTAVSSNGFASSKNDLIATATGRLGYIFGRLGQGMVYAKGGAAWARDKYEFSGQVSTAACRSVQTVPSPPAVCGCESNDRRPFNFAASETRVGWTVGAGIEWAVWENWSVKLEYDYLDLGSSTVTFNDPALGAATISVSQRISEVKLGVNYRFGSPLPTY